MKMSEWYIAIFAAVAAYFLWFTVSSGQQKNGVQPLQYTKGGAPSAGPGSYVEASEATTKAQFDDPTRQLYYNATAGTNDIFAPSGGGTSSTSQGQPSFLPYMSDVTSALSPVLPGYIDNVSGWF